MVTTFPKYFVDIIVTDGLLLSSKTYMSTDNDQFYIDKTVTGDNAAFAVLVDRYKNMVFTLALQMLKNREEAEEVAQDVFLKVHKHIKGFKGDSKFSTWMYRIAYNSCLDRIKTYKRKYHTVGIDDFNINQIKSLETAFDLMDMADRENAVKECLDRLPEEDAVLITLFYYKDLKLEEIAKVVGIEPNNAKVKLFRARKRLAVILKERLEPTMLENYGEGNR